MRIKKTYIVLSFRTTLDAMEWEKQCLAEKVPGRLIPLPREISAGCGLAWRMLPEEFECRFIQCCKKPVLRAAGRWWPS